MKQKLLAMMFVLFAVQSVLWAQVTSGYCGDPDVNGGKDVTWAFVDNTLTISGTGEMEDYSLFAPWWELDIKELVITEGIMNIGNNAFRGCFGLTNITIPCSVTSIGDYAFWYCTGLTSITIPGSVTNIGAWVFGGCSELTSIIVDENNVKFDSRDNCNAIIQTGTNTLVAGCKTTVIPCSVTSIGDYAFWYCTGLTSITIPGSVTNIGDCVFGGCSELTSIIVDENNIKFDSRDNCNAIIQTGGNMLVAGCKTTVIPGSVWSIGDYAFFYCTRLTSITIPRYVRNIGDCVFGGCSELTSIIVDENNIRFDSRDNCNAIIQTRGNMLVAGCKTTVIPCSVTSIGDYAFWYCTGLTSITIPGSVTSIGDFAFFCCIDLTSITIPESVTKIRRFTFYSCTGLTSITIPESVTSIEDRAFQNCTGLTDVTCLNPVPPSIFLSSAFSDIHKNAILRVPDVEAYKASEWAQYFSAIEPLNLETIDEVKSEPKKAPAIIYDLSGRRVTNPEKGRIYIVDGKKMVM